MRYVYPLVGGYGLEVSDTDINGEIIRPTEVGPDKKIKHRARKKYISKMIMHFSYGMDNVII